MNSTSSLMDHAVGLRLRPTPKPRPLAPEHMSLHSVLRHQYQISAQLVTIFSALAVPGELVQNPETGASNELAVLGVPS